jgi:hypothetical protein
MPVLDTYINILTKKFLRISTNLNIQITTQDPARAGNYWFLISPEACQVFGFGLHFVGFSMFCWMSVMCFDLFWTFGRVANTSNINKGVSAIPFCKKKYQGDRTEKSVWLCRLPLRSYGS